MLLPVVLAAALVAVFLAAWAFAHAAPPPAGTVYPWYGWGFPFAWFFFIPLFFIGFFALRWVFWGGGWWGWGWGRGWYYDPALQTLRERFARGEITKEQYDQMRGDLEASRG